jgi:hypothetical protein
MRSPLGRGFIDDEVAAGGIQGRRSRKNRQGQYRGRDKPTSATSLPTLSFDKRVGYRRCHVRPLGIARRPMPARMVF